MTSPCDDIELFVDGELTFDKAETFREHFSECERCQQVLPQLMELAAMGRRHVQRTAKQPHKAPSLLAPSERWARPYVLAAACMTILMMVVGAVFAFHPWRSELPQDVWLEAPSERTIEARLSHAHPGADHHRPLAARMMGGGAPPQEPPYESMHLLQKQGDIHGVAAANLVHGYPKLALKQLEGLEQSPEVRSDVAAALLDQDQPREALQQVDAALAARPRHSQALWNRGLALRDLGLPLLAARTFQEVASLEEPGWAREAAQHADTLLRTTAARRARWQEVFTKGTALFESPSTGLPEDFHRAPIARLFFYDAVRSATTRERVLALLPLAERLDERASSTVLTEYVRQVAGADFSRRGPLAREYGRLALDRLSVEEQQRLLTVLRQSGEKDLLLGALVHLGATAGELKLLEEHAATSHDPWFTLLAAQERAASDKAAGRWSQAAQTLLEASRLCPSPGLEYRCAYLERELSGVYLRLNQFDSARSHAEVGWELARAGNEWALEGDMLWVLANIARFGNDTSLARACFGELLERNPSSSDMARRVHQNLADIALHALQMDTARREIDAALATGQTLSLGGALTLAEISRTNGAAEDEHHLTQAVQRAMPGLPPGERLIATHVLGRFFIERDAVRGRELLGQVLRESDSPALQRDPGARRARAYSFTSMLFDAGKRGAFDEALTLFERERGQALPGQCLLAATVDSERTLVVVRDMNGSVVGHFDATRRQPLPPRLDGLVPRELLASLHDCSQVEVLARPPLHGRAGLLPPELAWSFLTRTTVPRTPPAGSPVHLVVSDVEIPVNSGLQRLNTWEPSFGQDERRITLTGVEATPSRVLEAMKDATEIDLVTHGVASGDADASYLQLAPGPEGAELRVQQLRGIELRGAPFVILVACHAALPAYALDEPLSLPAVFFKAGARGVLAATVRIPDLKAAAFFRGVRERMRAGTPPAVALRDERMQWMKQEPREDWLDSILLFE